MALENQLYYMIKKIKNSFLLTISLATFFGMLAGICGSILIRTYVLNDSYSSYLNQELNLNDLNDTGRFDLIIRDPKKVVVNQDVKLEETINSFSSSLLKVFKEIPKKNSLDVLSPEYYSLDKPLFVALVVTSDGWAMASLPLNLQADFNEDSYIVIASDRKIYNIDKINLSKNSPGDVIFFHLAEATNLAVRKIVPRSELTLGQSLVIFDNNNVWPTNLSSFKKIPEVLSSDSLNARLVLASNAESIERNSFIFNLAGDLVAVVGNKEEIIPAFSYSNYWQGFSNKQSLLSPFLGISYLDLSLVKIPKINLTKGALIYPNKDKISVVKNSPAASAGLLAGDIITWVNNKEINSSNDLADLIANYKPGEKITLTYLRGDQEKQVDLKLGELK